MVRAEARWAATHTSDHASPRRRHRLVVITGLLGALTVLHDLDHVRQGRGLHSALYGIGFAALVSIGITLVVLVRHPRFAKPVAIAQGVATVVGVAAVHAAPQWSGVTDSYAAADVDALSWVVILAMMCAGLLLAVVAARSDP